MTLGDRLKLYARSRWKTQARLAAALGLKDSQVSDWINDRFPPGTDNLVRLAGVGLNVHWLLTGDGDMDAPRVGDQRPVEDRLQEIVDDLRLARREARRGTA